MSADRSPRSAAPAAQASPSLDQALALLARAAAQSLGKHGLLVSDWAVLLQLRQREGVTLQQLASGAGLHKATASRTVKRMLTRGYLTCGVATHVNQGYSIALSSKGAGLVERRLSLWSAAELFPESILSFEELDRLASLLEKLPVAAAS